MRHSSFDSEYSYSLYHEDTHSGYGSDNNSSVIENSYLGDHDDFEINGTL